MIAFISDRFLRDLNQRVGDHYVSCELWPIQSNPTQRARQSTSSPPTPKMYPNTKFWLSQFSVPNKPKDTHSPKQQRLVGLLLSTFLWCLCWVRFDRRQLVTQIRIYFNRHDTKLFNRTSIIEEKIIKLDSTETVTI